MSNINKSKVNISNINLSNINKSTINIDNMDRSVINNDNMNIRNKSKLSKHRAIKFSLAHLHNRSLMSQTNYQSTINFI